MDVRGVVLAGGNGTRLGRLTAVTNKHLLPVAYQPMIYYPLEKLAGAGIVEVMIVSGTEHMGDFLALLGSGKEHKLNLTYRVQDRAGGIAEALGLAAHFCRDSLSVVLLGDNIFYDSLDSLVTEARKQPDCAWIVLKEVSDPSHFGVAEFDNNRLCRIVEKPQVIKSNLAVTGIYVYPPDVYDVIKTLTPSQRGELEITDVNNFYLYAGRLKYIKLAGFWTDAGTVPSLARATQLVNQYGVQIRN